MNVQRRSCVRPRHGGTSGEGLVEEDDARVVEAELQGGTPAQPARAAPLVGALQENLSANPSTQLVIPPGNFHEPKLVSDLEIVAALVTQKNARQVEIVPGPVHRSSQCVETVET